MRASPALTFLLVAVPGLAAAQTPAAPVAPGPPPRVGWEVGAGIYGGEINCENKNGDFCDGVTEAGGIDLHVNYFFNPRLGVFADVWPMVHTEDTWTFTHNIVSLGVKYRPAPILTVAAGLGSAQARVRYNIGPFEGRAETEVVGAFFASGAVEILRGRRFAVDLQARAGIGFYRENDSGSSDADIVGRNLGLGAAVTWF